jgi:hypothetical protein
MTKDWRKEKKYFNLKMRLIILKLNILLETVQRAVKELWNSFFAL